MIQRVLLLRRGPAATDASYVINPLRPLIAEGSVELEIVDSGHPLTPRPVPVTAAFEGRHVIVSRYCPSRVLRQLQAQRNSLAGLHYVVDDDIPAALDSQELPRLYRSEQRWFMAPQFEALMSAADTVTVTSDWLYERYQSSKTRLLHPTLLWRPGGLSHFDSSRCIVSFHATVVHRPDLSAIIPALRKIHERHPHVHIEVMTSGAMPRGLRGLPRCHLRGYMSWHRYSHFVEARRRHVMVVPLWDNPFNRGKSHIKVLDAAGLGAAGIYSARAPYANIVEQGQSGLLANDTVDAWFAAIDSLVSSPQLARSVSEHGQRLGMAIGDREPATAHWRRILGLEAHKSSSR